MKSTVPKWSIICPDARTAPCMPLTPERNIMAETASNRIVITVLGKNRPGIVAGVTRILSEGNVDIRDITQSIIEDIFTMTLLADMGASQFDFTQLQEQLTAVGAELGVTVEMQREDVFNFMYRL